MFKKFINYITDVFGSSKVEIPVVEEKIVEEPLVAPKNKPTKKRTVKTKKKK